MAALLGNLSTVEHPSANPDQIQYIYCVKLPFVCQESQQSSALPSSLDLHMPSRRSLGVYRPSSRRAVNRFHPYGAQRIQSSLISLALMPHRISPVLLLQPPVPSHVSTQGNQTQWAVVKVGKSQDPARRLHEIFDVFEKVGLRKQDYLGNIGPTDAPDEAIRKAARSINNIVFIQKVQDIGTAEADIRTCIQERPLGEHFINKFTTYGGRSLDRDGMTEWILMEYGLVQDLQWKFRWGQLYTPGRIIIGHLAMSPSLQCPPTGKEFFDQISRHCLNYAFSTGMYRRQLEHREEFRLLPPRSVSRQAIITVKLADFEYRYIVD